MAAAIFCGELKREIFLASIRRLRVKVLYALGENILVDLFFS